MVRILSAIALLIMLLPATVYAEVPANTGPRALTDADRMFLARQFLAKIKPTLDSANKQMKKKKAETDLSNLPEGEQLFFRIRLTPQIALEYQLLTAAENGRLMVSLNDFVNALEFPISFNPDTGIAQGWYIRENKTFELNTKTREVVTDKGTFKMSDAIKEQDGDLSVPSDELAKWFGIELNPNVPQLEIKLVSAQKLPIQEKIERHDRNIDNTSIEAASLPPMEDEQKMLDFPMMDVSSETQHSRPGSGAKPTTTSYVNVRTTGDFAHGTLSTQSQYTRDQKLTSTRINYKKESLDPELLGPLKARRFELGDITPITVPITTRTSSGVGARVTNKDPFRAVSGAYTDITGYAPPGWDVELYRQEQFLGLQTVGEDGRYTFSKVNLYGSDNTFRVVLYGSQGELREEEIYIPVDNKRLADSGSAYDVSIVRQDTTSYSKFRNKDEDRGAPSLTALYEVPVGDASAITTGLLTRQDDGNQKATGIAALSTTFADTLWNFNTAVDNRGEMAGEVITRKDIGKHQIRNEMRVASDKFDSEKPDDPAPGVVVNQAPVYNRESFGNELSISGPLDLGIGTKPNYSTALNYSRSTSGSNALTGTAGFSALFRPLSFSQQFVYTKNDEAPDDTMNSLTNISGSFGKNRVRLGSDYQIRPDSQLKTVGASVNRFISQKMDFEAGLRHNLDPRLTEVSAKLNWDTGYGYVSPGVSYNSDNDVIATLSSRFGLARDPRTGSPKIFDRPVTSAGGLSAFVYFDKNGDRIFNEGDEPIPDAVVKAPQNGGRVVTDEKGHAFFTNMGPLRLTDVYVDPASLEDPYWVPGYEGASIVPREGHITTMEFPVHMSGEVDGTVFVKGEGKDDAYPLKGVNIGIYDKAGKKIQGVTSEQDGFYIFSKIPPGSYYLVVDDADVTKDAARPLPQPLTIGYEGTTVYANNIYLKHNAADVPLSVLAGGLPYDAEMVKPYAGRNFALNLGQYKSRLAMGLAWFKVRALSGFALSGTDIIEAPSNSIPRVGDSGYVLRVSVQGNSLPDAYKKCSEIARKGSYCSVEILGGGLEQKVAARGDL